MNESAPQYIDLDLMTIWDTCMLSGLDEIVLLAMAENGTFPKPVQSWPLRWSVKEVQKWAFDYWTAKDKEKGLNQ